MTDILMTSLICSHRVLLIDNLLFGFANLFSCDIIVHKKNMDILLIYRYSAIHRHSNTNLGLKD